MKKKTGALILFLFTVLSVIRAYGESGNDITIKLKDASTAEAVAYATVSITPKGGKSASKYVLSNDKGEARLQNVAGGSYTIKAELLGYMAFSSEIEVKGNLDLGEVKMTPDSQVLDAANVSAAGNPIVIKKDTVIYNTSSFLQTDNDMLEDLIKKLPGMEVAQDGSVTFNGTTISKITIDGKTFFLDDPQLATKNIPSKVIDKLKVVQKKSEQAEFTGIDDGEEETIIDLSVKPGMMKGLFGNVTAGAGRDLPAAVSSSIGSAKGDTRYQGAAFIGRFTDKNQISLILNGNNTNNRGFNDLSGNMMQGMRGGGGMGRGEGWGNFQGDNGITTSYMAGLNGAWTLFGGKADLGANYLFNGTENAVEEKRSKTTYLDGYNLVYDTDGMSSTNSYGHRFGARLDHKFSENTSILFQPQINFGSGDYFQNSTFNTFTEKGTSALTNAGFSGNSGRNSNVTAEGFMLFRQRLGLPGRTLSVMSRYRFSNNSLDGFNRSRTRTYDADGVTVTQDSIVNQRFDNNTKNASINARVVYTEPLGKGFYAEANYRFSWNRNRSVKDTYDNLDNTGFDYGNMFFNLPGVKNLTYSNEIVNRYINQSAGANIMYQKDNIRGQVGVSINPTHTHNETTRLGVPNVYDSYVVNWAPQASLWYDISENSNIRFFYMGRSSQPSTSQLMPVPDNADPMNVSFGNPYLEPYFSHNLRGEVRFSDKKTFSSFNAHFSGGFVKSPIVNALWYTDGAQYNMPVNGPASKNANVRTFLNLPIAKSDFSLFNMLNLSFSESSSYVGSAIDTKKFYDGGEFDYEAFHKEYPSMNFTENTITTAGFTERLRFTYRLDNFEIQAGGRTRFNRSWYTINTKASTATWNNQLRASLTYNWKLTGIGLNTEFDYNWFAGYTTPQESQYVWNAEVSKLLFRNRFTLTLKSYDILNQARNLIVSDNANYHMETLNNTLGRYVILSLTYRFGTQQRGNREGPGGPGGPGGFRGGGRGPHPRF